jgi:hypothetical protein
MKIVDTACLTVSGSNTMFSLTGNRRNLQKESMAMSHANGTFTVKLTPQKPDNDEAAAANLGRMSLAKKFEGDLQGNSTGEMLSVMSEVKGSAGYVAIERVTGSLAGRSGSFALQHYGIMARGEPQLTVSVVPDSATGQLTGLSGRLNIKIENGQHFYEFEYALPEAG